MEATGNIIIGGVASVILWPIINVFIEPTVNSIKMMGIKKEPFYTLKEIDIKNPEIQGNGARVIIIAGAELMEVNEAERLEIYKKNI